MAVIDLVIKKMGEKTTIISLEHFGEGYIVFLCNNILPHSTILGYNQYSGSCTDWVTKVEIDIFLSENVSHLNAVYCKKEDIGMGSLALKAAIKYARIHGCTKMTGTRESLDDAELEKKLMYFYNKNGFTQNGKGLYMEL